MPEFRVGVMGRGGSPTRHLPFAQYPFDVGQQWGEELIEHNWNDFAGNEQGVILTIWDATRLHWFSQPQMGGRLESFLKSGKFKRWGYFPVDAYGVGGQLTGVARDALLGYDRVLAYTMFGKQVIEDTIGREVDWMPHGYNSDVFRPCGRVAGRTILGVGMNDRLVGCVMTNQARKDWGTMFGAFAHMRWLEQNKHRNLTLWAHVDSIDNYWDIRVLAQDFGLTNSVITTFTGQYNSEQLAYIYSSCDVTALPSLGEGFGYPIVESLACGVPVAHTNYAGGAELVRFADEGWLVDSPVQRLDGRWAEVRPVLNPQDWANKLTWIMDETEGGLAKDRCAAAVEHLKWTNLSAQWKKWLAAGL
jgi:glycosyltransferase involved in cell wall biosynthesis